METIYYIAVGLAVLISLVDYRKGIFLCILVDVVRDPVRKLSAEQSVLITVAGTVPWLALFWGVWAQHQRQIISCVRGIPLLGKALTALVWALLPGVVLSLVLYKRGWILAGIGLASYVIPLLGIGVGVLLSREPRLAERLLAFYSLANGIALSGALFEYLDWDVPGLGGIGVEWIRYRSGYTVDLISGFYRSPDIMGLHAAHVVMFAAILGLRRPRHRTTWFGVVAWAAFCVLICGRRKMIAIPLAFMAMLIALASWRGMLRSVRLAVTAVAVLLVSVGALLMMARESKGQEYTDYALTIFTESSDRVEKLMIGSAIGTLQQVGLLGAGIGTATQGRYYVHVDTGRAARGWQEDGVSRAFLEFGLPGVILLGIAVWYLVLAVQQAARAVPRGHPWQLFQLSLISVAVADGASYLIAHQHFSGDPGSALFVTMLVGIVLGMPRYIHQVRPPGRAIRREPLHTGAPTPAGLG